MHAVVHASQDEPGDDGDPQEEADCYLDAADVGDRSGSRGCGRRDGVVQRASSRGRTQGHDMRGG